MSFTEAGFQRVISGEFANGFVTGKLGVQLVNVESGRVFVKYLISALDNNEVIFEYDPVPMIPGQQVFLDGAEVKIPLEIVKE
jgi:hypothetical protein